MSRLEGLVNRLARHRTAREGSAEPASATIWYGCGVKANIDWIQGLGDEWRQYE
jgi:hypothetical protein